MIFPFPGPLCDEDDVLDVAIIFRRVLLLWTLVDAERRGRPPRRTVEDPTLFLPLLSRTVYLLWPPPFR